MIPKRIGILVPSTNTSVEADFQRLLSDTVSVHSERLYIPDGTMSEADLDLMNRDLLEKAALLATANLDVIAYACTSGSFYRGADWDEQVRQSIEQRTGIACVTTSTAVSTAFRTLNVQAISVMTPYPDWTNQKLAAYYTAQGLTVIGVHGDARAAANGHRAINDQPPSQIAAFALEHFDAKAQALFCSCTAWQSLACVTTLETALNVPVVTSNQATIWAALHAIDRLDHVTPIGRLFSEQPVQ